jgi:hypothetical protein
MPTVTATEARAKLYRLIDQAASSHEPIVITGKRANAVLESSAGDTLSPFYSWDARVDQRRFRNAR